MSITKETISKLEELTMLKLEESEKEALIPELENIIGLVNRLSELDTTGVEPLKHVNDHPQALRSDDIDDNKGGTLNRADIIHNAKESEGPFFTVPKVIKS